MGPFNEDWVKSLKSKDQFLKEADAHAENVNLSDEYDKIVPPKKDKEKPAISNETTG